MSSKLALCSSVAVAIVAVSGATTAQAQCQPTEIVRFECPRPFANSGTHMALSGNVLVVGAFNDTINAIKSGSAAVYRHEGTQWTREALLIPSDAVDQAQFGESLDVDGDIIIVGARGVDGLRGAAYVFRFDGDRWVEEAKLTMNGMQPRWYLGSCVLIRGETAMVSAVGADDGRGAVYVFRHAGGTWTQTDRLIGREGGTARFGTDMSLSNNVMAINCFPRYTYIFRHNGAWQEEALIRPSQVEFNPIADCEIDDDLLLLGTGADDELGFLAGAAYIFRFDGENWNREAKLLASDGAARDRFGSTVGLGDGVAAIGSEGDTVMGKAYLYKLDGKEWTEVAKLALSPPHSGSRFGSFVAIDEHRVLVGARRATPSAAYLFGSVLDCDMNGQLDLCDIERGDSEDCNRNGFPDQCEEDFDHSDTDGDGIPGECDNCPLFNPRQIDPCDMNCDGAIDVFDIEPFIELLFGGEMPCAPCVGDANTDGAINAMDIEPFLACLFP